MTQTNAQERLRALKTIKEFIDTDGTNLYIENKKNLNRAMYTMRNFLKSDIKEKLYLKLLEQKQFPKVYGIEKNFRFLQDLVKRDIVYNFDDLFHLKLMMALGEESDGTLEKYETNWNKHETDKFTVEINPKNPNSYELLKYYFDNEHEFYNSMIQYWKKNFFTMGEESIYYEDYKEQLSKIEKITENHIYNTLSLYHIVIKKRTIIFRILSAFHLDTVEVVMDKNYKIKRFSEL